MYMFTKQKNICRENLKKEFGSLLLMFPDESSIGGGEELSTDWIDGATAPHSVLALL